MTAISHRISRKTPYFWGSNLRATDALFHQFYIQLLPHFQTAPVTALNRHPHQEYRSSSFTAFRQHAALSKTRRGTAAGPFADYTDFLRDFALYRPQQDTDATELPTLPYLPIFTDILTLLTTGNIPNSAATAIRANYFLALHKDRTDRLKLCS